MKKKVILENGTDVWDAKKRYKVNQSVLFNGLSYQNVTGANSSPDALVDWVIADVDGNLFLHKVGDETKTGVLTIQTNGEDLEKNALILVNPLDEDFRNAITVKAGATANQRRYFQFLNHLGVRTNLLGFNANNDFIAFNSLLAYHYISAMANDITSINSGGSGHVRINADPVATGTEGMIIYDGTANPTANVNGMYFFASSGMSARGGRDVRAYGSTNVNYLRVFTSGSKCYLQAQGLPLTLYSNQNKVEIADSSTAVKATFDTANGRLGINKTSPAQALDVVGNGQFTGTVVIANAINNNHAINKGQSDLLYQAKLFTEYIANLEQNSTSNPIATIVNNELSGAISWVRNSTGEYDGTLTGVFLSGTVALNISPTLGFIEIIRQSDNVIRIKTYNTLGVLADDILKGNTVSIRVKI